MGYHSKKTFLYEERDEQVRAEFMEQLKAIDSQSIVYIDESGIKNNINHPYGRALRGTPVREDKN